ncbi:MAG: hypothetical protein WC059_03090 [Candidatus Paceibacterota bacterium]
MDPETKQLLKENVELSRRNNEMLEKVVRYQKWNQIYRALYWGIIIFSSVGAYYFIQPYLSSFVNISGDVSHINDITKTLGGQNQQQQIKDWMQLLGN